MDKDLLKIAPSDDLICWFLVLRPRNYNINEELKRVSGNYELEHSENFFYLLTDAFAKESMDGTQAFVIESMKMDNLLEW